jgi:hypothetical protein
MGFCTDGSFASRRGKTDATDMGEHLDQGREKKTDECRAQLARWAII